MSTVLAVNSDTVDLVRAMGRADVRQMFDIAVPTSFLAPQARTFAETPTLRLLWVGRIIPRKGLRIALDALREATCSSTLTIVGEAEDEAAVRKMIAEKGLSDRVQWEGKRLPWPEVRAAYLEHDALLFTSVRETCGAQLLEAMALGLPVLTLDLHGARDLVPEAAGIKVPVTTASQVVLDLAAAINRFACSGADEKSAMSAAAWTFAARNTWTSRAEEAERLYGELRAKQKVSLQ